MASPVSIHHTAESAAISDALLRAVIGLDTNDSTMFESAWTSDGKNVFEMDGNPMNGREEIMNLFGFIGSLDTQHLISNVRVSQVDGANTATLEAYAWAQHHRAGEGMDPSTKHLTSGSRYWLDLEKDGEDGLWKIRKWSMKIGWIDGDALIVGR